MSITSIYAALLARLDAIASPLPTQYENEAFDPPVSGAAYQAVYLLTADPVNNTLGGTPMAYREQGYLQVNLFFPLDEGAGNALTRAKQIRDWFARGASFTDGGVTVTVANTPKIGPGMRDDDRYMLPVSIPYFSHIA